MVGLPLDTRQCPASQVGEITCMSLSSIVLSFTFILLPLLLLHLPILPSSSSPPLPLLLLATQVAQTAGRSHTRAGGQPCKASRAGGGPEGFVYHHIPGQGDHQPVGGACNTACLLPGDMGMGGGVWEERAEMATYSNCCDVHAKICNMATLYVLM